MKFDVLTLFPEMFDVLNQSIIGRAVEKDLINMMIPQCKKGSRLDAR